MWSPTPSPSPSPTTKLPRKTIPQKRKQNSVSPIRSTEHTKVSSPSSSRMGIAERSAASHPAVSLLPPQGPLRRKSSASARKLGICCIPFSGRAAEEGGGGWGAGGGDRGGCGVGGWVGCWVWRVGLILGGWLKRVRLTRRDVL